MKPAAIPDSYFDQFQTPKYRSRNPLQRHLVRRFIAQLHELFLEVGPVASALEVGVGEGFLSGHLSKYHSETRFVGVDFDAGQLRALRRHFPDIEAHQGSIYDLEFLRDDFDLIICSQVLEHLANPTLGLNQLASLKPRRVLLTVPHEPWFQLCNLLRGKNPMDLGNDPGHLNRWGLGSLCALLEPRFRILRTATSFPWLLLLLAPK